MKKLYLLVFVALSLAHCGISNLHIGHLDHMPKVGWRHHATGNVCSFECFDDDGNVLGACAGCYDDNKQPIPGCVPGHWTVAPEKAEIDAKINEKRIEDHCRLTAYGCHCAGLAYPWTDEQKKVYPPCDPRVSSETATPSAGAPVGEIKPPQKGNGNRS